VLPEIDPGEAILAVNGVADLVAKEPVRITATELYKIDRFPATVETSARRLCRGRIDKPYQRRFVDNYQKTLDHLSEPPGPEYLEEIARRFPPQAHGALGAFMVVAARAWNHLSTGYPRTVKQELLGVRNLDVGGIRLGEWESVFTVIDDPLLVFDLVNTGRLQRRQVEAIQLVYPTFFIGVSQTIYDAMMARKAKRPTWEPDFAQGVATLLGVPGAPPDLQVALQAAQAETRAMNEARKVQQASRNAAAITAPRSQRQEISEAKEAQL
jgi:hypothetical protein